MDTVRAKIRKVVDDLHKEFYEKIILPQKKFCYGNYDVYPEVLFDSEGKEVGYKAAMVSPNDSMTYICNSVDSLMNAIGRHVEYFGGQQKDVSMAHTWWQLKMASIASRRNINDDG